MAASLASMKLSELTFGKLFTVRHRDHLHPPSPSGVCASDA